MKTRPMTPTGILFAVVLGATALGAKDTFVTNIRNVGDIVHESLCTVQVVAGGVINSDLLDCAAAPAAPAAGENVYGE